MKRFISLLLAVVLLCALCTGCDSKKKPQTATAQLQRDPDTLWVVSEYATGAMSSGGAHSPVFSALTMVLGNYRVNHPDAKIRLQMLPPGGSEREIILQSLRTEIMAGKGPDVFLLPSGSVSGGSKNYGLDGLFGDVELGMRNGYFADISDHYDADDSLNKDELKREIMDAGCYDGKRYVLPIRWDMPVVCIDTEKFAEAGLDSSVFSAGGLSAIRTFLDSGNQDLVFDANAMPYCTTCLFPNLLDYERGAVTLTQEEVENFLSMRKAIVAAPLPDSFVPGEGAVMWLRSYTSTETADFALNGRRFYRMTNLSDCIDAVGMAQTQGREMQVLPLPAADGTTAAEITYFGAVNAGSDKVEEAYDFLREFLLPDVQFGTLYREDPILRFHFNWPVRTTGSVAAKYDLAKRDVDVNGESELLKARVKQVVELKLTDDDLPLLSQKIDQVRFTTPLTYELYKRAEEPSNPEKDAKSFLEAANYHLAEH